MMGQQRLLVLALFLQLAHLREISGESHFSQLSDSSTCTCPGDALSVTYECTVMGGVGTVTIWTGSAMSKLCDNSGGNLFLLHSRFESDMNYSVTCGNDTIVGRSVRAENNSFTSQLTIKVNPDIIGDNITCVHNNTDVGNAIIPNTTTASFLPPDEVYIAAVDIGSRKLGFAWSPIALDCPAVHYNVLTSNCGSCPTTTNHTTVTCTDVPTNGSVCIFEVQPVVCGDAGGTSNYSLVINSTRAFRGTHSKQVDTVSILFLIVGVACLAISVLVVIVCCCLYVIKKQNTVKPSSRTTSIMNYDTISLQNECNTTQTEHNRDSYEYSELDEIPLDLKSLLKKLQGQVSKQWYQFGLALGLPMDVLEEFNLYSEEDCLVEVLDYWLKHHPTQPTWQEITDAQSKIETFNTPKVSGSVKRIDKKDTSDIPPPKPPRRSSSVTARNSTAPLSTESKNDREHEYEYVL